MEFRTYFDYFHTFSYEFQVQRTPTESGLPVVTQKKEQQTQVSVSYIYFCIHFYIHTKSSQSL